jgi:hypothetical protein
MDFQILRRANKVLVRLDVTQSNSNAVDTFCDEYKKHLEDAETAGVKLAVLFDLRKATFSMLYALSEKLKIFFGISIHDLSERTLNSCIVVINNKVIAKTIQIVLVTFPGTIPTTITDKYPSKN